MKASHPTWRHSWQGWREVIAGTWRAMTTDHTSLIAAGCAFYGVVAFFPAVYTLVAIYGAVFDPHSFGFALHMVRGLMPKPVYDMLQAWVHEVLYDVHHEARHHLMISSALMIGSSMGGTRAVMQALNLAFHETERRRGLELLVVATGLTLGGLVVACGALALIVALPSLLDSYGLYREAALAIRAAGAFVALVCVMLGLAALYQLGPSRKPGRRSWISAGSLAATVIWVAASEIFAVYNSSVGSLTGTTGPLSGALVMMGWFYVSSYAVLLGGELNAQMERRLAAIEIHAESEVGGATSWVS